MWELNHTKARKPGILQEYHTVIYFVSISAKFCINTVVSLIGTLVEAKICTFKCPMSAYFSFNKCPVQTHDDGANAKFSTN